MRNIVIAITVVLTLGLFAQIGMAQSDDWVSIAEESTALEQVAYTDKEGGGSVGYKINYERGFIEVFGKGTADLKEMVNEAQAEDVAYETAKALAYSELAEAINKVQVDKDTLVVNALMSNQVLATHVSATVANARVLDIEGGEFKRLIKWDGNTVRVWVRLGVLMSKDGLTQLFFDEALPAQRTPAPERTGYTEAKIQESVPVMEKKAYTGIIIDASGLGARPALVPRVLTPAGKEIYGPSAVDRVKAMKEGMVSYSSMVEKARKYDRAGTNPLVIKATGVQGSKKSDLVVTEADALTLLAADIASGLLKDCKVVFVLY